MRTIMVAIALILTMVSSDSRAQLGIAHPTVVLDGGVTAFVYPVDEQLQREPESIQKARADRIVYWSSNGTIVDIGYYDTETRVIVGYKFYLLSESAKLDVAFTIANYARRQLMTRKAVFFYDIANHMIYKYFLRHDADGIGTLELASF